MKLVIDSNEVHSQGVKGQTEFRVASNAKIMSMLSNQLYSDKVMAIIRELSANALDSHIAAGCPTKPFHVHLPCYSEPEFRIRDFGTGMTKEEIEQLYTVYGVSDKSDDNSFIGCLGLGSKVPFALVHSFNVISYINGMKYIYVAAKNTVGIPTLSKMGEESTTEHNGIEINFNVNQQYFSDFVNKAKEIYEHFPVMPIFTGGLTNYTRPNHEVVLQGTGWKLYNTSNNNSYAIMGYIKYPIEAKHFSKNYNTTSGNQWYHCSYEKDTTEVKLLQLGLELHFPIGTLGTNISREALEYTDYTTNAIKAHLQVVNKELEEKIVANFKNCKTLWEARCLYHELFVRGSMNNLRKIADIVGTNWNGHKINVNADLHTSETLDIVNCSNGKSYVRRRHSHWITAYRNTKFYVNDLKKGSYAIAERDSGATISNIWILTFKGTDAEQAAAKQYILDTVGITEDQLVYTSTLVPVKSATAGPRKTKMFEFKDNKIGYSSYSRYAQQNWWEQKTVDLNAGGIYIEMSGYSVASKADGTGSIDGKTLSGILGHASSLKIKIPTIYGLRPSHVKTIKDEVNWKNLYVYLKEELEKIITKGNYVDMVEEIKNFDNVKSDIFKKMCNSLPKYHHSLPATSVMGNFLTNYDRIEKSKEVLGNISDNLTYLAHILKCTLKTGNVFDCVAEEGKINIAYPLLQYIREYQMDSKVTQTMLDYVYMVDSQ